MSTNLSRNMFSINGQQNIFGGMPTYPMMNSLPDGSIQSKLASQACKPMKKDNIPGALQDLNLSSVNPNSMTVAGVSDRENARKAAFPSAVRPPPGFGPLPAKPSTTLSSTSVSQSTQPIQSGQPGNVNIDSRNFFYNGTSMDEQVDDYGWIFFTEEGSRTR